MGGQYKKDYRNPGLANIRFGINTSSSLKKTRISGDPDVTWLQFALAGSVMISISSPPKFLEVKVSIVYLDLNKAIGIGVSVYTLSTYG